ncbi:MAG: GNAT family N-acetyltransferase [Planctomycetota bacterium]
MTSWPERTTRPDGPAWPGGGSGGPHRGDRPYGPAAADAHGGHAAPDLPGERLEVRVVQSAAELAGLADELVRLEEVAAEPNPFFSRAVLGRALEHLGADGARVALVLGTPRATDSGEPVVAGLFPIAGTGARTRIWLHRYAFTGTPLIRADALGRTWRAFLEWSLDARGGRLLQLPQLNADGPVFRALVGELLRSERRTWVQDQHLRALFVRREDGDGAAYRLEAQTRKVRRNLRRARRLLAARTELGLEAGPIASADVDRFAAEFLELEARGWKGRRGTALGSSGSDARWFRGALADLARDGRALGAALRLAGRPAAMGVYFTDPSGSHGSYFKTAYDEAHAEHSVGALLQQELLDHLHRPGAPSTIDSCAEPGHPMIERIWGERRLVQTLWVAGRGVRSRALLGALPAARWVRSGLKPRGRGGRTR